ncbi:hypothetical protein ACJX0J_019903 [Zea mays]
MMVTDTIGGTGWSNSIQKHTELQLRPKNLLVIVVGKTLLHTIQFVAYKLKNTKKYTDINTYINTFLCEPKTIGNCLAFYLVFSLLLFLMILEIFEEQCMHLILNRLPLSPFFLQGLT